MQKVEGHTAKISHKGHVSDMQLYETEGTLFISIKEKYYKLYSSGDTGARGYGWTAVSCATKRDKFGCLCIQQ